MDLRNGFRGAEPVERLRAGHGVDARVRERDRLGGSVERVHVRERCAQLLAHLVDRLDGDHRAPEGTSSRVSLPVPAARSSTVPPRLELQALDNPGDRLVG